MSIGMLRVRRASTQALQYTLSLAKATNPAAGSGAGTCPGVDAMTVTGWAKLPYTVDGRTTWYATGLSGGGAWATITTTLVEGYGPYACFYLTLPQPTAQLCHVWNMSAQAAADRMGAHAYFDGSIVGNTGPYVTRAGDGASGSTIETDTTMNINSGWLYSELAFVPMIGMTSGTASSSGVTWGIANSTPVANTPQGLWCGFSVATDPGGAPVAGASASLSVAVYTGAGGTTYSGTTDTYTLGPTNAAGWASLCPADDYPLNTTLQVTVTALSAPSGYAFGAPTPPFAGTVNGALSAGGTAIWCAS